MKENVIRVMNNLSRLANFETTLNVNEVNFWLETYSDLVFCNGQVRRVVFDKITEKMYKIYSRSII